MRWILAAVAVHLILFSLWRERAQALRVPQWSAPQVVDVAPRATKPRAAIISAPDGQIALAPEENVLQSEVTPREVTLSHLREALQNGNEEPNYPEEAVRKGWQGTARLRLDFEGTTLREITLEESSGYGVLDRAALTAARGWHFDWLVSAPQTRLRVPVSFELVD